MFELQSKWIAGVLSNRITLPSQEEMMEDVKALYSSLEASGTPKRDTHALDDKQVILVNSRAYIMTDFHFHLFNFRDHIRYGG